MNVQIFSSVRFEKLKTTRMDMNVVFLSVWMCVSMSYAILSHYNLNNSMLLGGCYVGEKYTKSEQKHNTEC